MLSPASIFHLVSKPRQNQGLLYKHCHDSIIYSLIESPSSSPVFNSAAELSKTWLILPLEWCSYIGKGLSSTRIPHLVFKISYWHHK